MPPAFDRLYARRPQTWSLARLPDRLLPKSRAAGRHNGGSHRGSRISGRNLPAHLFVGAPFISCNRGFPSALLVASHNASISSRGRSLNSRPFFRASLSISRQRRENFVLAFLSAISGSIFRNRERFTAAKSTSPSSSSVFK